MSNVMVCITNVTKSGGWDTQINQIWIPSETLWRGSRLFRRGVNGSCGTTLALHGLEDTQNLTPNRSTLGQI